MFRKFLRLKHGRKGPAQVVLALNLKPPIITRSRWHASNIMRRQRGKSRRADRFKSAGHVWRGGSKPWKLKTLFVKSIKLDSFWKRTAFWQARNVKWKAHESLKHVRDVQVKIHTSMCIPCTNIAQSQQPCNTSCLHVWRAKRVTLLNTYAVKSWHWKIVQ